MSTVGWVFDLFRGQPKYAVGPDGRMALTDHLREVRARLFRSVIVLVVAFIVALFFYDVLLDFIAKPYRDADRHAGRRQGQAVRAGGQRHQRRPDAAAQAVRGGGGRRLGAVLALPDLGVHRPRPARPREEVVAGRGGDRRPAVLRRGGPRLLRAAQGSCGADRVRARRRPEPRRLRRLLLLRHPDAADLRRGHGDPVLRDPAEPRRHRLRQGPGPLPAVDRDRRVRLRRRRHAVDGPVLDADAGRSRC